MCVYRKMVLAFTPNGQLIPFNVRHLGLIPYDQTDLNQAARTAIAQALEATAKRYSGVKRARKRSPVLASTVLRVVRRVLELRGAKPAVPGIVGEAECSGTPFEPYLNGDGLMLLTVSDDGSGARELHKQAIVVANAPGQKWQRARRMSVAAKSKGWATADAESDRSRVEQSTFLVVCPVAPEVLNQVREQVGDGFCAGFGTIPVEFWGESELRREEQTVGLL